MMILTEMLLVFIAIGAIMIALNEANLRSIYKKRSRNVR